MSTSNYPKSYVLERMAARRVSLESRQKEQAAIVAKAEKIITDEYAEVLPKLKEQITTLLDEAKKAKLTGDMSSDQQTISRIRGAAQEIGTERYDYRRPRPSAKASNERSTANGQLQEIARELDALEHTEAYLRGTPVDEFSLTSLKRLGLIEAIKFNLDDAMKGGQK